MKVGVGKPTHVWFVGHQTLEEFRMRWAFSFRSKKVTNSPPYYPRDQVAVRYGTC